MTAADSILLSITPPRCPPAHSPSASFTHLMASAPTPSSSCRVSISVGSSTIIPVPPSPLLKSSDSPPLPLPLPSRGDFVWRDYRECLSMSLRFGAGLCNKNGAMGPRIALNRRDWVGLLALNRPVSGRKEWTAGWIDEERKKEGNAGTDSRSNCPHATDSSRRCSVSVCLRSSCCSFLLGLYCFIVQEWYATMLGCHSQGLVLCPLYPTFGTDSLKYILNQTQLTCIVTRCEKGRKERETRANEASKQGHGSRKESRGGWDKEGKQRRGLILDHSMYISPHYVLSVMFNYVMSDILSLSLLAPLSFSTCLFTLLFPPSVRIVGPACCCFCPTVPLLRSVHPESKQGARNWERRNGLPNKRGRE